MRYATNSTRTIKTANTFLVLDIIRKSGQITIEEIVHTSQLSRPTVLSIIEDQVQRSVIERTGFAESSVGRQPVLYALNTSSFFSIGIDFEFPPVRLTVVDLSGAIRYEKMWTCSFSMDKDSIIQLLVQNIQLALDFMQITCENIIGIGLGTPGTVNKKTNMSEIISRIPEWNKAPLSEILGDYFPVPIYVRNDAHLMSMAAQSNLMLDGQDFLYIAYRTGIGMAIIRDGILSEGSFGNSGYIGHTTVDINGDLCSCGRRGCLETFASKATIERKYAQVKNLDSKVDFNEILHLAGQNDPLAVDILETAGMYFGVAIANAVKMLDIYTIVIDDLTCSADHIFIRSIQKTVDRYCQNYALQPIRVIPNQLSKRDYALGAALFVLDTFFQKPKLKLSI